MAIHLHLVRHCQTAWNVEGRFLGCTDLPLTEDGHAQAATLVPAFARIPLVAIYASDLLRAAATAAPIAEAHGLPVQTDPRLREMHQGDLEGFTGTEVRPRYADFFAAWEADPADVVVPGGESLRQTLARASSAVQEIAAIHARDSEPHILIVSHGLTLQAIIGEAIGLDLRYALRLRPQHGSVSTLLLPGANGSPRHPILTRLNDRNHLDGV
ncbi:MAG: histidine phosphatase family protein [Chloroflexota bacterium]|nr:histidine phosphatase family protein [Chloroflexota bacterium]